MKKGVLFMAFDFEQCRQWYAGIPFDADMAPSLCMLTSVSPTASLTDSTCPVQLCDTDHPEHAARLCRAAQDAGRCVTVLLTKDGDYPCDRLLVPIERYSAYRGTAPCVGVRFSYDVKAPDILSKILQYADLGITLIDAYPENPQMREEGAQQALLAEFQRAAEALYDRNRNGQPIEFLPFSTMGLYAKHGIGAHRNARCQECSHHAVCGGRRLSYADCEVKKMLADCAVYLSVPLSGEG